MKLVAVYALLAAIATVANICSQYATERLYVGTHALAVAMIVGTGVGLVLKYVLDKRYIFRFRAKNALHDGKTLVLYTLMGVVTTAVFWAFEWGFLAMFRSQTMQYVGAVLGLAAGYFLKYRLDKRFVFHGRENAG